MSAKKPVRPRTRVGRYELGKTIGEGSFARVKFARNVENDSHVAIKILDRNHVLKHKMMEQLQKEISAMKMINHPNVIKIYEVMASKTKIYIVLELVNGGELFDKIATNGRLKEDEARSYFHQLINAVDYCHSRGVYHRDLKPENLLLDSNGILKVSDFGLSTYAHQEDELLRTACGTPNYVAPEVLNDRGYVGSASDIWSCGVILFVLMAGYLPFDEPNHAALYKKIGRAQFACPSWFSPEAKKLLKRILDPNPLTRIKIPELLQDEWFRKGYKPASFTEEEDINVDDVTAAFNDSKEKLVTERKEKPVSMNAFELISRSQSFNLENLFEQQTQGIVKKETHFTSQCPANEIMSKIEEAAKPLGFNVHKRNYKMKLQGDKSGRKGHLSVATEVFEVAPSLHMVELRKTGGDTLEFHKFYKNFSSGLQDVVWHSEATT
ncbi:CBL-interacting serine/threonine-protein kinase 9 isoform X1 [Cajanus cajan]|uniref:CBL-interacting serine/threonine-protein kinase 9 isoform X1 n=1 Tax=Cajanus cajan TaxID=3821 RepID=UPI00098DBED5|nr:CBL-interacting serine/threonine-protein kinase 9 isoform X1 [Cajanus cajan]XP_020223498.1 CBL-interacting serine/threonine-protein kinase 9 isoform X1 [Cajanus cajan]